MGKRNITTPDNIKFGDLSAEARMKILKMREKKAKEEEEKKLKKLYNKSNMEGK
tara:strand:- start:207 stop:368 length:162 start_codon:yes stop_codon:yes gene_type:complete